MTPVEQTTRPDRGALVLGGAHGTLEIARSLGRRGIPVWLITDDHPLAKLSRYVERSLSWPGPRSDASLGFVLDLARTHDLAGWVLFAGSDEDLRFVAQNHDALGAVFTLTTLAWHEIRWAYDKRRMHRRAAELGLAHPRTSYPRSRDDLDNVDLRFPVILKPTVREGRNAFVDAKAWRADSRHALWARYEQAQVLVGADRVMVQEFIPGDGRTQFSYAGVWDRGMPIGSLVARRRRQYPIEFGYTSSFVETAESREVEQAAARFLGSLNYSGLVEVEFKYDVRDRSYKMLDVNARAWTWMALGSAAGIDFAAIAWRLAVGERIPPLAARPGAQWLYFSRDLAASAQEMLAGRLAPIDYLRSLRRSSAAAVFAWDDPWPAVFDLPLVAARVAKRHVARHHRDGAASLQSVKLPS